jgi:hypothetical protein
MGSQAMENYSRPPVLLSTLVTDTFLKLRQLDAPRTTGMHSIPVGKFPGTVKPPTSPIPFLVPNPGILLHLPRLKSCARLHCPQPRVVEPNAVVREGVVNVAGDRDGKRSVALSRDGELQCC